MPALRDVVVNTLLGPDSSFRGDLVVDGFVRVDGDLRGSVRTTGKIIVSELARCNASIIARSAVVGGVIRGDVCVLERLTILDGGVIVGNVFAPKLDADGEVLIHGDIEVSGRLEGAEEALVAFLKRHEGTLPVFEPAPGLADGNRSLGMTGSLITGGLESTGTRSGPWQK
jgi:cytoskeletal protein CcmA (bactofilin family)